MASIAAARSVDRKQRDLPRQTSGIRSEETDRIDDEPNLPPENAVFLLTEWHSGHDPLGGAGGKSGTKMCWIKGPVPFSYLRR